ncbi:MAG: response regulator [Clostridiales Family XIII bacterium]|nr:response regulator [Clostridiales Family XIII bacterium]
MKKAVIIAFAIVILISVQFVSCASEDAGFAPSVEKYLSYKDVPGVTEEEIAAIEAIAANNSMLVYGMTSSTECFRDDETSTSKGYSILFCDWATSFFGVKFKPVIYEWDVLLKGLESGEIPFSGDISTKLAKGEYFMTDPIAERRVAIVSMDGMTMTRNRLATEGRDIRYGFLTGSSAREIIAPYLTGDYKEVSVQDYIDMRQKFLLGQIDALVMDETAEVLFPFNDNLIIEDFEPIVFNTVSMATADAQYAPFISVLQKYMDAAGSYIFRDMYEEGRTEYLQYSFLQRLSDVHRDYIAAHTDEQNPVRVALDRDNYPISFYNENAGEYQGIAVDLLRQTTEITGMCFEFEGEDAAENGAPPSLIDGSADMGGSVIRTEGIEGQVLFAEHPYKIDYYAFISLSSLDSVSLSDIPYLRVGLLSGTAYSETFYSMFPNHKYVTVFDTKQDAEKALRDGETDLFLGTRDVLLDIMNYHEETGFRENLVLSRPFEVYFAFPPDGGGETLSWIISRALDRVDTEITVDSWTRRVFDYSSAVARAQRPFLFGIVALLLVLLAVGFVVIVRSRSNAAKLEKAVLDRTEELEIQTRAAEVASTAKSDFLARMSHEIRTPLNAVIGMTEVAHRADTIEKKNTSLIEIEAASHHLLGVLNDVLDMAKIESGKFQLSTEEFSLRMALVEVEKIIKQRCVEKNIVFETDFNDMIGVGDGDGGSGPGSGDGVVGDKLRLKQVLINLLGNAVKFTPEGGTVGFSADAAENGDQIRAHFCVFDTGIGISEEQVGKLFNAFEQADETISVRFGGTGLGLSISQNLVSQMGGIISVSSVLGEGTKFEFTIDMRQAKSFAGDAAAFSPSQHDFTGKRILLAEDIDINRTILCELLSDTNVEIDEALDGLQALAQFENSSIGYYDTILMDIQMPNMNGYEATRQIRALDRERADAGIVPIIALTANAYKEDVDRAIASGMNGHLAKPININEVTALLEKTLNIDKITIQT